MHEVEKKFVFLITFALTISGLPICQEISPVLYGLPTSQPIATDWEMLNEASSVVGITAALPTPTQNCSHLSRSSLYLTRPNLDILGGQHLLVTCCLPRHFFPLAKNFA